jgi:hypothetical protein
VLVGLPLLWGARPVPASGRSVAALLAAVQRSGSVAYDGYAESVGRLPLPDAGPLDQVADLLGGRSRIRVWWAGGARARIDVLSATGERDTYLEPGRTVQWDSDERVVRVVFGQQRGVRVPQPLDLLPATLGRRLLAAADPARTVRGRDDRVAGRSAATLTVRPDDARSLVGRIDVAVDRATGLPLRVAVTPLGARGPAVETALLQLRLATPGTAVTSFTPPPDAGEQEVSALDVGRLADEVAPIPLPPEVAGLRRRSSNESVGGARSYGDGYAVLAVVPLETWTVRTLQRRLGLAGQPFDEPWGEGQLVSAGLLSAMTLTTGDRGYVLVGTVPTALLKRAGRELAR